MVLKYDFGNLSLFDDPMTGLLVEVNNASSSFFWYAFLILVFIVAAWSFIRRTQDVGKSMLMATHILAVLTIIVFYAGKVASVSFISEIFLFTVLVVEALAIGGLYFMRMSKNEG